VYALQPPSSSLNGPASSVAGKKLIKDSCSQGNNTDESTSTSTIVKSSQKNEGALR